MEASPRRGPVLSGADTAGGSHRRGLGSVLSGGARHIGKCGFVQDVSRGAGVAVRSRAACHHLLEGVCYRFPLNPAMGWDPADGDLVATLEELIAGPHVCDCIDPARTQFFSAHPFNSGGGVDEECVTVSAPPAAVNDTKGPADGECFRVKNLLVAAKVVAASGPAPGGRKTRAALTPMLSRRDPSVPVLWSGV